MDRRTSMKYLCCTVSINLMERKFWIQILVALNRQGTAYEINLQMLKAANN